MKKGIVNIVQDPDHDTPIHKDVLAMAIIDLSDAMTRLSKSGLNRKAIITLLHDSTKQGKREIEYVLNAIEQLVEDYT
jgi:hypothetical protein